jgi:uncharacterized SAM-binding protein YcdF (DUF218 family)
VLLLYLKTLLRQLVLPPASLLLLALLGLVLLQRRPKLGRALIAAACIALWLLATPLVAGALTRAVQNGPALDLQQLGGAQAIVIIGGGRSRMWAPEYAAPAAGGDLLERLAYGAYVARRTGLPILVSGFRGEVDAMRATLQQNFDLRPRWTDALAYDTFENARNSAALLQRDGLSRIILVTSATHMRRAANEFSAAGLTVMRGPVGLYAHEPRHIWDYVPSGDALSLSYLAAYELIGEPVRELLSLLRLRRQPAPP